MVDRDVLGEVLAAVDSSGLLRNPRCADQSVGWSGAAIVGEVDIEGQEARLRIVLSSSFPFRLPTFVLEPWDALGFIPHINPQGVVCFLDPEGIVLDRRRPAQIAADALERTVDLLIAGVTGRNQADFADEFEVYWSYLPDGMAAVSVLEPGDRVEEATFAFRKNELIWVANFERDIAACLNAERVGGIYSVQKGLYLPLEPGALLVPPRPDRPFWNAEEARTALLSNLSEANQVRLRQLIKARPRVREYVVVKLPRPSGGASLFGIRYEQMGKEHPLRDGGTARRLAPFQLIRHDRKYLIGRGGGMPGLLEKRVLLVGCGAVGGHLAFELARAGLLDLTLVDDDKFKAENTFRHALGQRYTGKNKAKALKEELEAQLPYVRVRAIDKTVEAALADGSINLADFNLVVLAVGNPTVELMVNEQLRAISHRPAGVFTWLEPLGIGGHALLTGNGAGGGCFECLFTPPSNGESEELANRAAFAAPGQSFGRALSGCGSLHTPYGSIDAVRTANLAARLAIDALTGKEPGNPLRSWKGDAEAFEAEGFRLSTRYGASQDELDGQQYTYVSTSCRICGECRGNGSSVRTGNDS